MPSMIEDPGFGLTPASGTAVATAGLFGMMVGALGMGRTR
jgi:AAHS family benzoate transporter-like MFS transporter